MSNDSAQSAFQFANVGSNFLGQKFSDLYRKFNSQLLGFVVQNSHSEVEIRGMDVGNQTAAQTRLQTGFDTLQVRRRLVCGNDYLTSFFNQGVKGIKELFLGSVFAAHKLNVIHHQNVNRTELFLKCGRIFVTQRSDKLVHKLFCREINDVAARILLFDMPCNGVHQVGFAQTDAGIQEQGVKRDVSGFGNFTGCGISEFIGFADNEIVKGILRIQRNGQ